jgi:hypothetical protein
MRVSKERRVILLRFLGMARGWGVLWDFFRDIVYSFLPLRWLLGASRQGVHIIRERRAALMFRDMLFFHDYAVTYTYLRFEMVSSCM